MSTFPLADDAPWSDVHATVDDPGREPPGEVYSYVTAVSQRLADMFGTTLIGVYTTGSLALGDFQRPGSDVDLMAVVEDSVDRQCCLEVAERLDHKKLPCPAAGLEFVLYPYATVTTPSTEAGYLLNLNTGLELPPVVSLDSSVDQAFWFVIDRAIARQSGKAVLGPPPQGFFRTPSWDRLIPVVTTAVETQRTSFGDLLDNVILNANRALRFAEDRHWYSKPEAGRRTTSTQSPFAPLVGAAMPTHRQRRQAASQLARDAVGEFLDHVLAVLRQAGPR